MKFIDEFRDVELAKKVISRINHLSTRPARLMEFCGGHTVSIMRSGLRQLLPPTVEMLSGPGCPVCVTANADIDKAIALANLPDTIVTSFGDMMKVPGSYSSLQQARAAEADIRIVYSTQDALQIARENPAQSVIFIGIGFETTAPTIAASIIQAEGEGIKNYYVLCLSKLCPPIMKALLDLGELKLDGIVCPGHVSVIIGSRPYEFIPREYGVACVVAGFEPLDILLSVEMLVKQIETGKPKVEIAYRRSVNLLGNKTAQELMDRVFDVSSADWRGIGPVPASGLKIRKKYARFDAEEAFSIDTEPAIEPKGCICGDILRGVKTPLDCKLFNKVCTPEHPVGPCMVSSEGSCAAYHQYGTE
ncbi:MAG TPA: hydrogenase formation protein HypD [Dehalococcoidia bacterium]|jgi:hydrogenase expression/formation protein HypD